jgi:asparagine synthase (glutamine-hydrolysing)
MFALKVTRTATAPNSARESSGPAHPAARSSLTVQEAVSQPYGFRFRFADWLLMSESLTPVSFPHFQQLVETLTAPECNARALPSDLLLLVAVNNATGALLAASNIACSRPLYYCFSEDSFLCATSMRALTELGITLRPDDSALPEFLVYRYVVAPRTLFQDIKRLPGGHLLRLNLYAQQPPELIPYPFRSSSVSHSNDLAVASDMANILTGEIQLSLHHCRNPALQLSGGLDSGLLGVLAQAISPSIASVSSSFSFADTADSETHYAASFARHLRIPHYSHVGTPEKYLAGLVESIAHAEEPVHHLQSVMFYLLYRDYARDRHTLVLSGEGADGLFGNHLHFFLHRYGTLATFLTYSKVNKVIRLLSRAAHALPLRVALLAEDTRQDLSTPNHTLWSLGRYGDPQLVKTLLGCDDEAIVRFRRKLLQPYASRSLLDQTTILSLLSEGSVSMYIWSRLAESQGIAVLYPFVTSELVDLITSLPWHRKLHEQKYFIRLLLRQRRIPQNLITRRKLSFGFPYQYWALPDALFQPLIDMAAEMWEPSLLRRLQSVAPGYAMLLWNLLNYFLWHKLMIQNADAEGISRALLDRYNVIQSRRSRDAQIS